MKNDYTLHLEKWKHLVTDASTLVIGIDVSRLKHDACFGTKNKIFCRKFTITNDLFGFEILEEKINSLCIEHGFKNVLLGMEPTSVYWCCLNEYLKSKNRNTCLLDPISVFHNRKTLKKDNGKSDKKDAYAIFDLMSQQKFYFPTDNSLQSFSAKLVMKNWMNVQRSITSSKNRLRSFLSLVFPELETETENISSNKFLDFLHNFPTPMTIASLSEVDFIIKCKDELKCYKENKLKVIYSLSRTSIGVCLSEETDSLIIRKMVEELEYMLKEEDAWLKHCYKIANLDNGYDRVKKIKGLGDRITTGIMLSMGNYKMFSNATQITKLAGLNLVDKTSGSSINNPSRISHQGNHDLRYWAYHGALQVIKYPGPFQSLFIKKKKSSPGNGSGKRALIAVSDKLIRVIWAILKKGGEYNTEYNPENNKK